MAAREVLALVTAETFGGEAAQLIAIANEDMYHAALATWVEDDWYVIDYTARQFDPMLPFPFVAQQHVWKATIDGLNEAYTAFCADPGDPASEEERAPWADDLA